MIKEVRLTEISRPKQWKTISTKDLLDKGYPVYGANGKIGFFNNYTHVEPTLLITCRGATCGSINISEPKAYVNGNAMALDNLSNDVDLYYLKYFLEFRGFVDVISGSAQPQITGQNLKKIKIPLPSLSTQKKIAAILDSADQLRNLNKQLIEKYDELMQSLFLDMFGDPVRNEKGWLVIMLSEICNKITDGTHQGPKFIDSGIPFLLVSNIVNNEIVYKTKKYISEEEYKQLTKSTPIEVGDLLYTSVGSYGNPAIIKSDRKFCFQRHIAHFKPNHDKIDVVFLHAMMASPLIKRQANKFALGVAQKTLNLKVIKSFKVFMPPYNLQNQFSERIQAIEAQKAQAQVALQKSENLFNALLQKALRGELVV